MLSPVQPSFLLGAIDSIDTDYRGLLGVPDSDFLRPPRELAGARFPQRLGSVANCELAA